MRTFIFQISRMKRNLIFHLRKRCRNAAPGADSATGGCIGARFETEIRRDSDENSLTEMTPLALTEIEANPSTPAISLSLGADGSPLKSRSNPLEESASKCCTLSNGQLKGETKHMEQVSADSKLLKVFVNSTRSCDGQFKRVTLVSVHEDHWHQCPAS